MKEAISTPCRRIVLLYFLFFISCASFHLISIADQESPVSLSNEINRVYTNAAPPRVECEPSPTHSTQGIAATNSPSRTAREPLIKAELVFRFRTLFNWPNIKTNSIVHPCKIGVLGSNPYGGEFDQVLRTKKAVGFFYEVVSDSKPEHLKGCQIIFIPQAEAVNWSAVHREWDGNPVLLVGEQVDFIKNGGMVWIGVQDDKPFLEISRKAVESAQIQLSSQLYHLTRIKLK